MTALHPRKVQNFMAGRDTGPADGAYFKKINPHNGAALADIARSTAADVAAAVTAAQHAQPFWAARPAVRRAETLFAIAEVMKQRREDIAKIVHWETGKSVKDALGETDGAIALAYFMAGEGQRLYGRTTTSGVAGKLAMTIREPVGLAGLIVPANTPIANIAWKVFPALICGNGVILKTSEDAPITGWIFTQICAASDLPEGVLNVIHGLGPEAGAALVAHPDVALLSFTGSTAVGRSIAETAGKRLAKISLELGGKNPLVVCNDADMENAIVWSLRSAFSNAGQRCASASRIIVLAEVYDQFTAQFVERTKALAVGTGDDDFFGPVINEKQLTAILTSLDAARTRGIAVLCGGERLTDAAHRAGFYLAPTVLENVPPEDPLSTQELFGPIVCLYKVQDYDEALALANNSPYGLTACIHTKNVDRALDFTRRVQAGTVVVNGGTYGSEPHMPFGGVKQSGNGTREPGTEALDIYSNSKNVYQFINQHQTQ